MNRKIFLLILLIVAVFSFAPVRTSASSCQPVTIEKYISYCYPSAEPPYYLETKYTWWIKIIVTANTDLSNVVVYDRLGAELMLEGLSVGPARPTPPDYNFTYVPYEWNGDVYINNIFQGKLNKQGVNFDDFQLYWTGKSVKANFQWNVGAMSEGETRIIYLIVSTDTNPAGWQEYTSCGCYYLNSGTTVKAIVESTGKQFSAYSGSIEICVSSPM